MSFKRQNFAKKFLVENNRLETLVFWN